MQADALFRDDRPLAVIRAAQFERAHLDTLLDATGRVRALHATPAGKRALATTLAGSRVLNLFSQPSTRSCESFAAAANLLGATVRVLNDLSVSSFAKGETVEDATNVFATFFDVLVIRHADPAFVERAAATGIARGVPVISSGSGTREHPTQGLLDIATLDHCWRDRGGIDGKRLLLAGDIGRNRAARSLATLLSRFDVPGLDIVCPAAHQPEPALLSELSRRGTEVTLHRSLDDAIGAVGPLLDAVYMTRLQQEWDEDASALGTADAFVLHPRFIEALRPDCQILHPLPRVNELPVAWEALPTFRVWDQVQTGLWVRAALFAWMLNAELPSAPSPPRAG